MTVEEVKQAFKELKEKGMTEEQLCDSLYSMYRDDKLDIEQLDALSKLLGYEVHEGYIEAEKRRLKRSDLSYITGMKLSVAEEINVIRKIIPLIKDEDIIEDLKEALYCLRYTLSDETIEFLQEKRDALRDIAIDRRKEEDYSITINKNIKCKSCKYGVLFSPYDTWCIKYDLKPNEVLYEGKDCPKYCETAFRSIIDELNKER